MKEITDSLRIFGYDVDTAIAQGQLIFYTPLSYIQDQQFLMDRFVTKGRGGRGGMKSICTGFAIDKLGGRPPGIWDEGRGEYKQQKKACLFSISGEGNDSLLILLKIDGTLDSHS